MDIEDEPPSKRHKKHKKKHKHRRSSEIRTPTPGEASTPNKSSIKLKLKLGKETMGTKSVMPTIVPAPSADSGAEAGKSRKTDEDISDEEKWLDALEKGSLDSYTASLGKKNPAMLTARQKALLHGTQDDLLQLPSGYKNVELTEEQKQRRQEKARRRREQASEKMENDKTQTLHKLLKKQESKNKRAQTKTRGGKRSNIPRIMYRSTANDISINLPADIAFPLTAQAAPDYPVRQLCSVEGCSNPKTSVCSKTGRAVCGLACYKANLAQWTDTATLSAGVIGNMVEVA